MIVLDTNIVLDLLLFHDPAAKPLGTALESRSLQWLATIAMREELQRVLGYRQIVPRLAHYQRSAEEVLAEFDRLARLHAVSLKAGVTCADPDDQKFIDLAVAYRTTLLSKDRAVLCMAKRLHAHGVRVASVLPL
ncbi:MAG: PIN domain-containing protein [Rhodoferax sp.]|nr:PIN domain-containing protein [Rhodoferax sp.]